MITTNLPLQKSLRIPYNLRDKATSEILVTGPFFNLRNPGLSYQHPVGTLIMDRLGELIDKEHLKIGALKFKMPGYMKRGVLDAGEAVQETFAQKFVMLPNPMEDYMVLTTHEMEVLEWLSAETISYRSLPMRLFFRKDFLRPLDDPKGILRLREFGVQAMLSLDAERRGFEESLINYATVCESIFDKLGIPIIKRTLDGKTRVNPHNDFDLEYFFKCPEGNNLPIGDNSERIKSLSLAMGYLFHPRECPVRIIGKDNTQNTPLVGTYAMGMERLIYSAFESSRDDGGFNLPEAIRPFDAAVLVFDDYASTHQTSETIYHLAQESGTSVLLDNRRGIKRIEKSTLSDLMGIPRKVTVSKTGIRARLRNGGVSENLESIDAAINFLKAH